MADYKVTDTQLNGIADAINTKGGTTGQLQFPDGFVSAIQDIPGGGGVAKSNDVNFYDYDGTIVYSYSAADFANLTAMPANPSHDGLTAQGWNWSLSDAKTQVAASGKVDIGQMYITSDGKTRLYITVDKAKNVVPLYWYQSVSNGVSIDWGDGTSSQTISGTGNKNTTHTYAESGNYVIALTVSIGKLSLGTLYENVFNKTNPYTYYLNRLEIGSGVDEIRFFSWLYRLETITIPHSITVATGTSVFKNCYNLRCIIIPNSITALKQSWFQNCYGLHCISIPKSVTQIGGNCFESCYSLKRVIIPNSVTSIGSYAFEYCYSLSECVLSNSIESLENAMFYQAYIVGNVIIPNSVTNIKDQAFRQNLAMTSVTIPSSVTNVGTSVFYNCSNVCVVHIKPTTPPVLSYNNLFGTTPSGLVIYVPSASLSAYQTANNWSNYSSYMVGE